MPNLEREAQVLRDLSRLVDQPLVGELLQVEQVGVVLEVHRLQLRIAVEAEATNDGTLKILHQPVREEEGRRPLVRNPCKLRAGEHLVAVRPGKLDRAVSLENRVQRAGRAAIAVDDDDLPVPRRELREPAVDRLDDLLRIEMMHRRNTVHVDVPAMAVDDGLDLFP